MYIVKLPSGEYINLAFVQRVEVDKDPLLALVHWSGWDNRTCYAKEDAKAIIKLLHKFLDPDISFSPSDHAEEVALDIFNTFNPDAKTT